MRNSSPLLAVTGVSALAVAIFCAWWFLLRDDKQDLEQVSDPSLGVQTSTDNTKTGTSLDVSRQRHIWDAEHVTFEIETYVGKPLTKSLQQRNLQGVQHFFRDDFFGRRIDSESTGSVQKYVSRKQKWNRQSTGDAIDSNQFAEYLISCFDSFASMDKLSMRVLKIDARDGDSECGIWDIQTLLTGLGESDDGEKLSFSQQGRATVEFNTDEQIRKGTVISRWEIDEQTLVTSPVLMQEATAEYSLDKLPLHDNWQDKSKIARQYTQHVAVADYDRDGLPDIVVSTTKGDVRLLRTLPGGGTQDMTIDVSLPERVAPTTNYQTVVTWIDIDNDAYPELLIGQTLFKNKQGKKFEWIRGTGLKLSVNPMGTAVADFDCDGLLDLYVIYQGSGKKSGKVMKPGWINDDESGEENQLWKNMGDGTFQDVTQTAQAGGGMRRSFAAIWLHANDDRFPDLYVANDFGKNSLLINTGKGTFTDNSIESQTADFATSMGVAAGDINGDGRSDIYVANMYSKMGRRIVNQVDKEDYAPGIFENLQGACAGNRLYVHQGEGKPYAEVSESLGINKVGWAYSPAFADFDRDGFLDIYATAGFVSYHRNKPDG